MKKQLISIQEIPAILWGDKSSKVYIYVHGKMGSKNDAELFAEIAIEKGYQVLSFDLPQHGDRKDNSYTCDIHNGIHDLMLIKEYVDLYWKDISLFGCSLGACFSLYAYSQQNIKKCLFQSPILDMEALIENMFIWFDVSKKQLEEEKEIETPIETLSWDYYCFIKEHPITEWNIPTHILYGALDNLQSRDIIDKFCNKFQSEVTIAENSEHAFLAKEDKKILRDWYSHIIDKVG